MITMITNNSIKEIPNSLVYIAEAIHNNKIAGDGNFTKKCNKWIEENINTYKCLLTTSCTHALEMSAILLDIKEGDEIIMPSYTFVSTANAFVLRGAKIVFVDIRPDTMNIDEELIEEAITNRTKAIVVVHYAGVSCEMDEIGRIAQKHNLYLIEDAAQGFLASYKGRSLGTMGDLGCFSFHETKNITMGEGGAIVFKDNSFADQAEIIREKGTNRSQYYRGQIDKYTWVDRGSSYLPSDINAAYLYAQLEEAKQITSHRLELWNRYYSVLLDLELRGYIEIPHIPEECQHNGHIFYIKTKDSVERDHMIEHLKRNDIQAIFHYIPLHSSSAGKKYGVFRGEDRFTTKESERLLRLPIHSKMGLKQVEMCCELVQKFYI